MSFPVPYVQPISLTEGKVITIDGTASPSAKKITIAFVKERDLNHETPFVLDFRFEQSVVVLNHRDSNWGSEERPGPFPLRRGERFEVRIEIKGNEYHVKVNNAHFHVFRARSPKDHARNILVDGDVSISRVHIPDGFDQYNPNQPYNPSAQYNPNQPQQQYNPYGQPSTQASTQYPGQQPSQPYGGGQYGAGQYGGGQPAPPYNAGQQQYSGQANPPVPFNMPLQNFRPGSKLFINGASLGGQRFSVYFLCGPSFERDDVALVVDIRTNFANQHNVVVVNSRTGGAWGSEQPGSGEFPFPPNKDFEMVVKVKEDAIKIVVDDEKVAQIAHRIRPERVTFLNIQGEVRLNSVRV